MAVMLSLLLVSLAVGLSAAGDVSFCQGSCEQGWVTYAGRCYQYFPALKTWIDAEVQCLSLGGNLASVHSSDANQFITTLIKSKDPSGPVTWLGGSNCVRDSTWLWTDGSKWDFTNWNAGEPNNVGGVEKCFHINFAVQSGWNDINCVSQYPFVCVKNIK
ncbi:lactose-binding lectin l-2-like isoform X5 [Erpetoichthys calabaricus]|uniref:Lactose-binding lectin l-2-like n=1 Tax=Erpetoichthys calabaricus TaxID=27687 RepID=A0A8C4XEZ2_ERPCA|nr:lactose-binding lectin l-2-like isoform X5 [Erpetoichthys calabaricus]